MLLKLLNRTGTKQSCDLIGMEDGRLRGPFYAGMLTMTNHNPSLTNEQIKELLESNFGPIYSIETPYNNPYQRNVEFMDVRHAQKGRQAIGQSAKIPTISEV